MKFSILVGCETEKFNEFHKQCSSPCAQLLLNAPDDDPSGWEWAKEAIGIAIVSYLRENYCNGDSDDDCSQSGGRYDM